MMNLVQRIESLCSDWRQEIERRRNFLLPIGADLQLCLAALERTLESPEAKANEFEMKVAHSMDGDVDVSFEPAGEVDE